MTGTVLQEDPIPRPIIHLDPQRERINVVLLHRLLCEQGLARDGPLEACDVVFCTWPRYEHYRRIRDEGGHSFRLNQIPHATERLQQKQRFTRLLRRKPYVLRTYLESCRRRLRGIWVEKPFNLDRGEGITFLRDPRGWRRENHLLQRYLEDAWLLGGKKTEVRLLARVDDDGSVTVYREGLVRVAREPYSLDDLDPMIHNANAAFQARMGVEEVEQHLLTAVAGGDLLDAMVAIVQDALGVLRRRRRFQGSRDFEAMGFDFLVDRRGRPYLIEANRFPGLYLEPEVCARFYRGMLPALYGDLGTAARGGSPLP